jgi:predicted dehydrogenase
VPASDPRAAGRQYERVATNPVRIGCLGAARIAPAALLSPAHNCGTAVVAAVAARDRSRAEQFAVRHSIPRVYDSYHDLVEAPDLDAVYIPLPNGLHAEWTLAALAAGKHVLCEKPFTANGREAAQVAAVAAASDRIVMEAFHWRYHPLATRVIEIVTGGDLGEVRRIDAALVIPLPKWSDIRWQLDLAGGSLMDVGCYPVHMVRTLAAAEPAVISATAKERTRGVDRWMRAELSFSGGRTGRITAGMWSATIFRNHMRVIGERGVLTVINPLAPQAFNLVVVRHGRRARWERVRGRPTYEYQLQAFVSAIREGGTVLTGPSDSLANMKTIDAIYGAAGLEPRIGSIDRR